MKKKTILLLCIFEGEIGIFLLLIKNILKNIRSSAFLSNCQKFKKNWTNCCRFDVIYYELMSLKKMSFSLKITFSKCMQTALFLHSKTWTKIFHFMQVLGMYMFILPALLLKCEQGKIALYYLTLLILPYFSLKL